MNIKLEQDLTQTDIEVLIKYAKMNPMVKKLETIVRAVDRNVKCNLEQKEVWINASDIFYIESVDKRTYVYDEKKVYSSKFRLYQLQEELRSAGFVQVSKACIMNINKLESLLPLFNSRMEATLSNGEKINVTRKFIPGIRAALYENEEYQKGWE